MTQPLALVALFALVFATRAAELPIVTVTRDDTLLTRSCRILIPAGTAIADANNDGVIQVGANNLTIEFMPGSELRGASADTPGDKLSGMGIRVAGHKAVTVRNARIHGFKNGLVATRADRLTVAGGDFSGNYRQRLRSTPMAGDESDWMFPHHNDETKWRDEYGGAVCVEESSRVTIREIRVRRGQNGIILDRVNRSRVYDNDCSFLSGWGLALWRSSDNLISRNAFDFCVRGHVEGVYNRGNDSAGILCFEQCNRNIFAENSVTHGGDGFFGFAGHEAIGETWMNRERERLRKTTGKQEVDALISVPPALARRLSPLGCNDNLLIGNDFSYASAHGIEMTFSEGNRYVGNRVVENAICGLWGGFSSGSLIAGNNFTGNGGMAYGLERGAINMEHAANNLIVSNRFENNRCALHFWWNNGSLLKFPGVSGGPTDVSGNIIARNELIIDGRHPFQNLGANGRLIGLQLRSKDASHVHDNRYFENIVRLEESPAQEFALDPGCEVQRTGQWRSVKVPTAKAIGKTSPIGARAQWRGRDQIILDEWGPWDHESPLLRPAPGAGGELAWEIFGVPALSTIEVLAGNVTARQERTKPEGPIRVLLAAPPGVTSYRVRLAGPNFTRELAGITVLTDWDVTFFPQIADPLTSLDQWRAAAKATNAAHAQVRRLDFPFGMRGPRDLKLGDEVTRRGPGPDRFGMIARTRLALPAGNWRLTTTSDDGVRVMANDRTLIENWTIHGAEQNEAVLKQTSANEVELVVEYFEGAGAATLKVEIEPLTSAPP